MQIHFSPSFIQQFAGLPKQVQKKVDKQISFLQSNIRHPSLHAKKYDETQNIWQARVNGGYRFYFQIIGDTYELLFVIQHPK